MKKRIEWIDLVRAVGMFMIVMGHTLEAYTYSWIARLIFAVHVPVFFILSGYLFREKSMGQVIKNGARNLLLPYLATVVLLMLGTRLAVFFPNIINNVNLHDLAISALYGSGTTISFFLNKAITINAIGAIWFLLAMFLGNIIFNALMSYTKQHLAIRYVGIILLTVLGFALSAEGIILPWSLNAALASQAFYLAGYEIKYFAMVEKRGWFYFILGLLLWGISVQSGFFYLNIAYANAPLLAVLGGIGGSFVLMFLAAEITKFAFNFKYVEYFGQMSLIVLCIHLLDLSGLSLAGKVYGSVLQSTGNVMLAVSLEILYRLVVTVIGIIVIPKIPYLRSFYLNRKYPFFRQA